MKITFISGPVPELTNSGDWLVALEFTTDTPIRLVLRDNELSLTIVTDEAEWKKFAKTAACNYRIHGETECGRTAR